VIEWVALAHGANQLFGEPMSAIADELRRVGARVETSARREATTYAAGAERPIGGYAVLLSTYGIAIALLGWLARRRDTRWQPTPREVAELGIATHKLSRLVTKDTVTAVVRAPFTTFEAPSGEGEVHEQVRGEGLRHAVGELVTCPFCVSVWIATALAFGVLLLPRFTRVVLAVRCAVAGSDYLQLTYAILQRAASGD
jgi:Protein of unknown function (DUF1360)